jgi:hypothetical protein
MPFVAKRSSAIAVRPKPITSNPKYQKLAARAANLAKRTKHHAMANEGTLLVLAGAAAPALAERFYGKPLPTLASVDPGILYAAVGFLVASQLKGKGRERLMALSTGMAAPAIARTVASGSIKVAGDDEASGETESSGNGDAETGAEINI